MHVYFEERVQRCQDQEISDYVWKVASLYVPAGMVSDTYQRRGQYGGGDRLRGPPGEQRGTEGDTGCGDHFRNPGEALDRSAIDHKELRQRSEERRVGKECRSRWEAVLETEERK